MLSLQWCVKRHTRESRLAERRQLMIENHLRRRGISDERVLDAMARVPRHAFVSPEWRNEAYSDHPLPIGEGQTISQPYVVALMTEALLLPAHSRILELGTGSGYQTAILIEMGAEVWTIERSPALFASSRARLAEQGVKRVHCYVGDGTAGLVSQAPFDRILATGSLPAVPETLLEQLRPGGIFVGPIGHLTEQTFRRVTYHPAGSKEESFGLCRFVPLIGAAGWSDSGS
jgi:protein-L-isoaspartate(D-aspartate) O-methyltransferase